MAPTGQVDYATLARQAGALSATPPPQTAPPQAPSAISGGAPSVPQAQPNTGGPVDYAALARQAGAVLPPQSNTPGEVTNDVGNTVIVPQNLGGSNEEPFSDTLARAIQHQNSLSAAQQQEAIAKETTPGQIAKDAGALAVAIPASAALPFVGAESLFGIHTAIAAGLNTLGPAAQRGVVGLGEWAVKNPVTRALVVEALKKYATKSVEGAAAYGGYKVLKKVLDQF